MKPGFARAGSIVSVFFLLSCPASAQFGTEFWIRVADNFSPQDNCTRYFGNYFGASYGLDSVNPTLQEAEYPPPGFYFDARWVNIPGRPTAAPAGLGFGSIPFDFRGFPTNPLRKDTFALQFVNQDPNADSVNFTFVWPDYQYLYMRCDSMLLVDPTGQVLPTPINMFYQRSLTLMAPQDRELWIKKLWIYTYGVGYRCDGNCEPPLSSELRLNVSIEANPRFSTTLHFGNHLYATYSLDSVNQTLQEVEFPGPYPPPFFCFESHWVGIPGRPRSIGQGGMGRGLMWFDFRGLPEYPLHKDTFAVMVSVDCAAGNLIVQWDNAARLAARCDSMFLVDSSRTMLSQPINMFEQSSVTIDSPSASWITLFIYKYGVKIVDAVKDERVSIPTDFILHQNYPNPFNPTTTIRFDLPHQSLVTLKLYNVLGEEVKTLAESREYAAGRYEEQFDATGLSSGVYFYRMLARSSAENGGTFQQVRKMMLIR